MGVSPDNQTPHSWVTYKEERTLPALHVIFSKFNASPLLDSNAKHMNIYMFPFRYGGYETHPHGNELPHTLGPANPQTITVTVEPFPTSIFKYLA